MEDRPIESVTARLPSLFIDGYFSQRLAAGESPTYGYPKNHLPKTGDSVMQVVTGFIATRKSKG